MRFLLGATGQTRTADLLITNQLLYQLSHSSKTLYFAELVYYIAKLVLSQVQDSIKSIYPI